MIAAEFIPTSFAINGDKTVVPNNSAQGFVNYELGYTPSYELSLTDNVAAKAVERRIQNYLFYALTNNNFAWQRQTFAPWSASVTEGYAASAMVMKPDANGNDQIWRSLVNANVSDPTTNPDKWERQGTQQFNRGYIPMPAGGADGAVAEALASNADLNLLPNGTFRVNNFTAAQPTTY